MACRERGGSKILLYLGLFLLVAGPFCQCSHLARLKTSVGLGHNSPLIHNKSEVSFSGRLLISQQIDLENTATSRLLDADSDYQADTGWDVYRQPSMQGNYFSKAGKAVTDQLIKMDPKVECTSDSMKLQVQDVGSTPGSLIWVDRGNLSPLPLSKLPQSCGYTVKSTQKGMILVAPYHGCFVTLEDDSYVLPLLWWGLPVRMTCPLVRPPSSSSPMVTCHTDGMIVKTEWIVPLSKIKINVNGKWELLNAALRKCGIGVVDNAEGVVLSVHYGACVKNEDGRYTVELAGEGETEVSCPSMAPGLPERTKSSTQKPSEPPNVGLYPSHPLYYPPSRPSKPVAPHKPGPVRNPFQIEGPPGHVKPPLFPFFPVWPEYKPGDKRKPAPNPSQQETPDTPSYLFPYPLNPTLGPVADPVQKVIAAPHKTEDSLSRVEKPYYPFLSNQQPENKPSKDAKTVTSPKPVKPQPSEVPSGHSLKPYYPFLPNPLSENKPNKDARTVTSKLEVQPDQGGNQASPNNQFYPLPAPDIKPTSSPQQSPEVPTVQAGQPFYHYLYPLFPEPENEPQPSQPQEPEKLPGKVHQPVNPYPSNPMPGLKPNDKPMPAPKQPEDPLDQMHQPNYPYTYPLYPIPSLKEPITNSKPEVPPGEVTVPANPYTYPLYPLPNPKEPVTKPSLDPQNAEVSPGPVNQPPNPYNYLVYPMASPKEPNKIPMHNPLPEITPGEVHLSPNPYPHPLYPSPNPKEPTKRPMLKPQARKPEVTLGQVDEIIVPYPYPVYPMPSPKKISNKPEPITQMPEVPPDVEQPTNPFTYPLHPMPRPQEPTIKPIATPQKAEVPPDSVKHPASHNPYPLHSMATPKEPTKKPTHNPQKPEVSSKVEEPTDPYLYPLYPMPSPKESAKKPMPQLWPFEPQIYSLPPEPVKLPTAPYQNPLYSKPGHKGQAKKLMPNPWLLQPEVLDGQGKQLSDPYPFPLNHRPGPKEPTNNPIPDPWPFKPQDLGVPHGQVKQPSDPYNFPFYPRPNPKEPAKTQILDPWPLNPQEPEAPFGHVKRPVYPFWHEKLVAKPAKQPQPPASQQTQVQQPHNPYLVYPMSNPAEFSKKPIPFPQPPDTKQPEVHGHVHQPANPFNPFNIEAVIKNPPKPEVPGNVNWPVEPQTPGKPDSPTHIKKPEPIQPQQSKMPHPQWQQSVTLPPAKEPQWTIPPPQPPNVAVVPEGSPNGCIPFCTLGFSNCCPQISFHQHLYLASPGQSDKVKRVVSQEFPLVASMAYHGPVNRAGYFSTQPFFFKPNSQYSKLPYENSQNLPPSQLSPQVLPVRLQNPVYTPLNQEAQNEHIKQNGHFKVVSYPPGMSPRSHIASYLQQQNLNRMPAPRAFSLRSDGSSHLGVHKEFGPFVPSMLNDAEATNASLLQNLPHLSHQNKQKKTSKRDQTGHSLEPKGYVLLQRGPPGREPRGPAESKNNFRVGGLHQNVPGQPLVTPLDTLQHVNTWNWKPRLGEGLKSSRNHFKPQRITLLVPGSKERSSTQMWTGPWQ
ncbi:uncharacterized protein LOC144005569 [Festucalex cinctus]